MDGKVVSIADRKEVPPAPATPPIEPEWLKDLAALKAASDQADAELAARIVVSRETAETFLAIYRSGGLKTLSRKEVARRAGALAEQLQAQCDVLHAQMVRIASFWPLIASIGDENVALRRKLNGPELF